MCKEEIAPSRVKFFAQALEIRSPPIDVIDTPSSEEAWNSEAHAILFSAVVDDLYRSETSRLTQRDIRDLKEFDMLPGAFLGDDCQQRQVEDQVADLCYGKPREELSYHNQGSEERANTSRGAPRYTSVTEADPGREQTIGPSNTRDPTRTTLSQPVSVDVPFQIPLGASKRIYFPSRPRTMLDIPFHSAASTPPYSLSTLYPPHHDPSAIYDTAIPAAETRRLLREYRAVLAVEFFAFREVVHVTRRQRIWDEIRERSFHQF